MYKYLDMVNSPEDLKKLNIEELNLLCQDIRAFLLENISKTGGHLSSNLGVVEMTVALHYVFNSPCDKLLWDVGHQSYIHKILTGRKDQFESLRQYDGLSGFLKRNESEHDVLEAGHSTTSISAALGYAVGRDLNKEDFDVLAIIGDGALTGGMAYEAMNIIGHKEVDVKIIFNDNEMSISENVGAVGKSLNRMRVTGKYKSIKKITKLSLNKIPFIGKRMVLATSKIKESFKQLVVNGGFFFEEFGITYMGPFDGHNMEELVEGLTLLKNTKGPAVIHIRTQKGKGYKFAEEAPGLYHGVGKFKVKEKIESKKKSDYSAIVGDKLIEMATKDKKLVAVSAAMISGTGLTDFNSRFRDRCIDVGIAEQNAVTMCAGMALNGFKPYFVVYSTFLQRAYDQILHDVCMQNLPVTFCIDRAGLVGNDGETHHGVFDLSYLSHMPNIKILAPKDKNELEKMLEFSLTYNGPLAIRYPRGKAIEINNSECIDVFKAELLNEANTRAEVTIIAAGKMVAEALVAREILREQKIEINVINLRSIKPIDIDYIYSIVKNNKLLVTMEDNSLIGGAGQQIVDLLSKKEFSSGKTRMEILKIGIGDEFVYQGDVDKLFDVESLSGRHTAGLIVNYLKQ